MNKFTIVPSTLQYKSAPEVNQDVSIFLQSTNQELTEYDRISTLSLAQVYDDERQRCTVFRPTFNVSYLYNNTLTGTTKYVPFRDNLYYVNSIQSKTTNVWLGYPQYYEFDFFRPDVSDNHFVYKSKSAFTYNWMYYFTYAHENSYTTKMSYSSSKLGNITWTSGDGIPFYIENIRYNGTPIISFNCIVPHGLSDGEYVKLSFSYGNKDLFQVYNLGNGMTGSEVYVFNIVNLGFTGNTFNTKKTGTFKRVINKANLIETTSKYYVRKHKVLTNVNDVIVSKNAFEKNAFNEERKFEYSVLTPDNRNRISQKNSSNSYNMTTSMDLNFAGLVDNQMRPITEIFLTIINRGYSGYFNYPTTGSGLKQGWGFNVVPGSTWWDGNNTLSNTNITTSSYVLTNGVTTTFYYNNELNKGDLIDGDFCEWNDYEQSERVLSPYYQKIKYNPNVFQVTNLTDTNAPGFYYQPHNKMSIRVFSSYIETAPATGVENIPNYAFYSRTDGGFRWRDLYTYGFVDDVGNGVDFPFLNTSHYPFTNVVFRLVPEGANYTEIVDSERSFTDKPETDDCE